VLFRIELPLGRRVGVNAILIEGQVPTLVDTGLNTPESLAALERGLAARGYSFADLRQVVITHGHTDHFGAAAEVARRSGAPLVADPVGAETMRTFPGSFELLWEQREALFAEAGAPLELLGAFSARRGHFTDNASPASADWLVRPGDSLDMGDASWQVIATPGHAPGEVSFFEPNSRALISGDIVVATGGSNVTLYSYPEGRPDRWIPEILASLDRLANLEPQTIYPGHGDVLEDGVRVIAERKAGVLSRLEQVEALASERPITAYEVSLAIYQPPLAGSPPALAQSIGYLEGLEAMGRVRSAVIVGRRRYSATP
jgi:glyoxylase-like metal-dependent hydrolase (beta-lactamase superfamily II)